MNDRISLMVDEVSFKEKPKDVDIPQTKKRFENPKTLKHWTIDEIVDAIGKGYTIAPCVTENGLRIENFKSGQLIIIDVDNKIEDKPLLFIDDILNLYKQYGIEVLGYHESFSHTPDHPKYHILFMLDKPIYDANQMHIVKTILISIVNQADPACKDVARMYFSTNAEIKKVKILNKKARINLEDLLKIDNDKIIEETGTKNFKNSELKELVDNFDLLSYLQNDNKIKNDAGNIVYFETCSICGHKDCLRYYRHSKSWYCFGANGSCGGNIIDYLININKFSKSEAINYFKYDLLKLERPTSTSVYINEVKKYIEDSNLDIEVPSDEEIDWISVKVRQDDEVKIKINCPRLVRYLHKNLYLKFARSSVLSGVFKFIYIDNSYKQINDDELGDIICTFIPLDAQYTDTIEEVIKKLCMNRSCYIELNQMNAREDIINFKNGILNLMTGELLPHSPEYLSSIQIPIIYKGVVEKPKTNYFDNFMYDFTSGNEEIKQLILEAIGIAISNIHGYRMKKLFLIVGPGHTGKSQLKLLMTNIIGPENCSSADFRDIEQNFGRVQLMNKRLIGSNDMSGIKLASLEKIKQLTGGDYINSDVKYNGAIEFRFYGVIVVASNMYPIFSVDRGDHVYDRFCIIETNNIIPEEKQDKLLVEHMLEEKDYIVHLAIEAAKKVIKNGYRYDIPECCKILNDRYKVTNNSFLTFYEECMEARVPGEIIRDKCTCGSIYRVYKAWCKDNFNGYADSKSEVRKALEKMGKATKIKTKNGNEYYVYLQLKQEVKQEYREIYGFESGLYDNAIEEIKGIDPKELLGFETPEYDFEMKDYH